MSAADALSATVRDGAHRHDRTRGKAPRLALWHLAALVLALAGIAGSVLGARALGRADAQRSRSSFGLESAQIAATLRLAIQHEDDLLVGASAFLLDDPSASESAFRRWVATDRVAQRYPELLGLTKVVIVPARQLQSFAAAQLSQSATPGLAHGDGVLPPGSRPFYCLTSVQWARSPRTAPPAGIDWCRAGIGFLAERDTGAGSSTTVSLGRGVPSALGIQIPLYRGGVTPATVTARRAEFVGWVGMGATPTTLLQEALEGHSGAVAILRRAANASALGLSDPSAAPVFSSGAIPHGAGRVVTSLDNGSTVQTFKVLAGAGVLTNADALALLLAGSVMSVLLALLVLVLGTGRARALRLAGEAERATHAKDQFLSRMSHELRTPLNAIVGFSQLLGSSELTDRQHRNVGHVIKAGDHLAELVNEVLAISQIRSGDGSLAVEPVRLRSIVDDAIEMTTPLAESRRIVVSVTSDDGDELWASADSHRLRQVLLNLLSNAIKYNRDAGRVVVGVRATDQRAEVLVADDGPGIAPDLLVRLFTPFDRLGAEQTTVEGTGLGLTLSKAFVEAMGGTLGVSSTLGKGSVFTVELPACAPGDDANSTELDEIPADACRLVLSIEDNKENLALIEGIFNMRPEITLLTAVQGTIGVELARKHRPDLVLLDLDLPDISGEEVIERLRADPATAHLPVVVVSADVSPGQARQLIALGAVAYVTKPFDIAELLRIVDETLLAAA